MTDILALWDAKLAACPYHIDLAPLDWADWMRKGHEVGHPQSRWDAMIVDALTSKGSDFMPARSWAVWFNGPKPTSWADVKHAVGADSALGHLAEGVDGPPDVILPAADHDQLQRILGETVFGPNLEVAPDQVQPSMDPLLIAREAVAADFMAKGWKGAAAEVQEGGWDKSRNVESALGGVQAAFAVMRSQTVARIEVADPDLDALVGNLRSFLAASQTGPITHLVLDELQGHHLRAVRNSLQRVDAAGAAGDPEGHRFDHADVYWPHDRDQEAHFTYAEVVAGRPDWEAVQVTAAAQVGTRWVMALPAMPGGVRIAMHYASQEDADAVAAIGRRAGDAAS